MPYISICICLFAYSFSTIFKHVHDIINLQTVDRSKKEQRTSMIPKIANYPIHVYVCLWYVVTFYYTFKYAFRLPLSVIGRRHGGPGEVTRSRLEDDGMRRRYVSYIILLFNPALCTIYIMIDKHTSLYRWHIFSHFTLCVDPIVFASSRIL